MDQDSVEPQVQRVLDALPDAIVLVTTDGRIGWVNQQTESLFGYSRAALRGQPVEILVPEPPRDLHLAVLRAELAREGELRDVELELVRKDGSVFPVRLNKWSLYDAAGQYCGSQASVRDITHERMLERQMFQAQKLELMGVAIGSVVHDLNNLLMVIRGYSELLGDTLPADDSRRQETEEIQAAVDRSARLIHQFLAFGRRQVLAPQVLNLNMVVATLEPVLRRLLGGTITLVTALEPALGLVEADSTQLEQVLLNLVINARDAMPREGTLTIETANVRLEATESRRSLSLQAGSYVRLTVRDTGMGMDTETQAHLFEPFFTTKAGGTGLGLTTVYGIVRQSGGAIQVTSGPGQGTTFMIDFPQGAETSEAHDQA